MIKCAPSGTVDRSCNATAQFSTHNREQCRQSYDTHKACVTGGIKGFLFSLA
jgi:hypothetical protein